MSSIVIQGDTSGSITVEAPSVAGTHTLTLPKATGNIATDATVGLGTKNLIINGDMRIDQRNAGASVTLASSSSGYPVDRYFCFNNTGGTATFQQSTDVPTGQGFDKSVVVTVTVTSSSLASLTHSFFRQQIEGNNCYQLSYGTANAKTLTLSFWVKSSVTGTFGGSLSNSARNRSYPFSYTISSANTWEKKTITIEGDTTGTWLTDTGVGLSLTLSLGSSSDLSDTAGSWYSSNLTNATGATNLYATSGATWYITSVQLEVGENATPFERRMYSQELAMCQRYFYIIDGNVPSPSNTAIGAGFNISTTSGRIAIHNPVEMRSTPTFSYTGTIYLLNSVGNGIAITSISAAFANKVTAMLNFIVASGMVAGNGTMAITNNGAGQTFQASAEL